MSNFVYAPWIDQTKLDEAGVYLVHSTTNGEVIHYTGLAKNSIRERIDEHAATMCYPPVEPETPWLKNGPGAKLLGVLNYREEICVVSRIWDGKGRDVESRLKKWNKASDYCPACLGERAFNRANF